MSDAPKLARKETTTTVVEYDSEGRLTAETTTTVVTRFEPEPKRVVGFSSPYQTAK